MKLKIAILLFIIFLNNGCDFSQEGTDCSLVDCAVGQLFSVELIDNDGYNLITNGTYAISEISITTNESEIDLIPFNSNDFLNFIVENKSGENIYTIQFSESEIDTLNLNLVELDQTSVCCGPYYAFQNVTYNDVNHQILPNENDDLFKITVVK